MSSIYTIKRGDLLPVPQATTLASDGAAINLTTATGVVFRYRLQGTTTWTTKTAVIVTAASGIVRYDWVAPDTDITPGLYEAEYVITWPVAKPQTVPNDGFVQWRIAA